MKNPLLIIAFTAAMMFAAGNTANARSTETRTVTITGSYDGISVAGSHTINFQIGSGGEPITLIGTPEELDNIEIFVRDNTLRVKFRDGYRAVNTKGVQVYVKNPTLKSASAAGSGRINITGTPGNGDNSFKVSGSGRIEVEKIDCNNLEMSVAGSGSFTCNSVKSLSADAKVSGSGKVTIKGSSGNLSASVAGSGKVTASVSGGALNVKVSGSGKVTVDGTANSLQASIAGSGKFEGGNVSVQDADVKVTGSGSVSFKCHGALTASVAGSGKVYYSGNPTSVKVSGKTKSVIKR